MHLQVRTTQSAMAVLLRREAVVPSLIGFWMENEVGCGREVVPDRLGKLTMPSPLCGVVSLNCGVGCPKSGRADM